MTKTFEFLNLKVNSVWLFVCKEYFQQVWRSYAIHSIVPTSWVWWQPLTFSLQNCMADYRC